MSESPIGSHLALLLMPPRGAHFGNIVTTVYSAIAREISAKGAQSRFVKAERGKFARNGAA
jgi:hypothetical protein